MGSGIKEREKSLKSIPELLEARETLHFLGNPKEFRNTGVQSSGESDRK